MTAAATGAAAGRPSPIPPDPPAEPRRPPLGKLRRRADFLLAARARRQGAAGLVLQARPRGPGEAADPAAVRLGFTCSRKVGNAVERNRARRRLKAAAAEVLPGLARPGWDYVLIGRPAATAARPFDRLKADLVWALARVHGEGRGE